MDRDFEVRSPVPNNIPHMQLWFELKRTFPELRDGQINESIHKFGLDRDKCMEELSKITQEQHRGYNSPWSRRSSARSSPISRTSPALNTPIPTPLSPPTIRTPYQVHPISPFQFPEHNTNQRIQLQPSSLLPTNNNHSAIPLTSREPLSSPVAPYYQRGPARPSDIEDNGFVLVPNVVNEFQEEFDIPSSQHTLQHSNSSPQMVTRAIPTSSPPPSSFHSPPSASPTSPRNNPQTKAALIQEQMACKEKMEEKLKEIITNKAELEEEVKSLEEELKMNRMRFEAEKTKRMKDIERQQQQNGQLQTECDNIERKLLELGERTPELMSQEILSPPPTPITPTRRAPLPPSHTMNGVLCNDADSQWACNKCTFRNHRDLSRCEMCDAPSFAIGSTNLQHLGNNNNDLGVGSSLGDTTAGILCTDAYKLGTQHGVEAYLAQTEPSSIGNTTYKKTGNDNNAYNTHTSSYNDGTKWHTANHGTGIHENHGTKRSFYGIDHTGNQGNSSGFCFCHQVDIPLSYPNVQNILPCQPQLPSALLPKSTPVSLDVEQQKLIDVADEAMQSQIDKSKSL